MQRLPVGVSNRVFAALFSADLIVRSAYQIAKLPVLPLFAYQLGADEVLIGLIVSVSTVTGLLLKPIFGFLSDRWGRWLWLWIGTGLFAGPPFLYQLVETPEYLVALRLFHGLATAIYGPITLAYVAQCYSPSRAEAFGWFGLARTASYIIGPAVGGALLIHLSPEAVFSVTGIVALAAFIPVGLLRTVETSARGRLARRHPRHDVLRLTEAVAALRANSAVLYIAVFEMTMHVALYALRTFLPIYAIASGATVFEAGLFFTIQEAVNAALRPLTGRLGDQAGHRRIMGLGLVTIGIALIATPAMIEGHFMLALAASIGTGQAIVLPSALALASRCGSPRTHGTTFGAVGAFRNAGKVMGPVLGGFLLANLQLTPAFAILGLLPIASGTIMIMSRVRSTRPEYL